ncbi:MAG: hypothetical protein U0169_13265 [Polyangiaceae bacterium]
MVGSDRRSRVSFVGIVGRVAAIAVSATIAASAFAEPKVGEAARVDAERSARARPNTIVTSRGSVPYYTANDTVHAKPVVVLLHGMCGAPENACPFFADGGRDVGHLVCPRANHACPGGGFVWSGSLDQRKAIVDDAVESVRGEAGSLLDEHGSVLAGFSQGAFLALDLASRTGHPYQGLLLVGASVKVDRKKLEAAGIRRLVLAAGAYDGARPAMEDETKRLGAGAMDVRFVSLGAVPHTYVEETPGILARTLRWLGGGSVDPNDGE